MHAQNNAHVLCVMKEEQNTDGEAIKYRGKIHWVIYIWPAIWMVIGLMSFAGGRGSAPVAVIFIVLALELAFRSYTIASTSEFVITTKRVVMKTGCFRRNYTDVLLSKIESFNVNQGIFGRILNYGTLIVGGTGGSKGGFKTVSNPLEFRKRLMTALKYAKF